MGHTVGDIAIHGSFGNSGENWRKCRSLPVTEREADMSRPQPGEQAQIRHTPSHQHSVSPYTLTPTSIVCHPTHSLPPALFVSPYTLTPTSTVCVTLHTHPHQHCLWDPCHKHSVSPYTLTPTSTLCVTLHTHSHQHSLCHPTHSLPPALFVSPYTLTPTSIVCHPTHSLPPALFVSPYTLIPTSTVCGTLATSMVCHLHRNQQGL